MDFILSLTHFCEIHGPKSVLCTQVLPLDCVSCHPNRNNLQTRLSCDSLNPQDQRTDESIPPTRHNGLHRTETNVTLPADFSAASTTVNSIPASPVIEQHPLFRSNDQKPDFGKQFRYGRGQGETCASCSFGVPQEFADKLPCGAPGSVLPDGKGKNGAPVLRSREFVCLGSNNSRESKGDRKSQNEQSSSFDSKQSSSYRSSTSSHVDCHDHLLTYLTSKSPDDAETYSNLRASVIRTLSCELLPRGMSEGPFCFGDSTTGYTIAYVFRLTDPKARGRRRAYALLALAGKDARRAFRACPLLWEAFAAIAKAIEGKAQHYQDEQRRKDDEERDACKFRNYTPVSSFLTQRTNDPDGHPRRAGQVVPRSLAEIVGDENIFTTLHQYFVAILRSLGDRYGGMPMASGPSVHQSVLEESYNRPESPTVRQTDARSPEPSKAEASTAVSASGPAEDVDTAKARINKSIKSNTQCAPMAVSATATRQVVV